MTDSPKHAPLGIEARLVVRAVNSHAALVGALQDLLKSHEGMHYERGCDESSNRIEAEDTAEFMANDPTVRAAREALKNAWGEVTVRGFPFSIYSPQGKYEGRFDPKDCPVTVHEPGRGIFMHQCRHKPKRSVEGFPDIVMCEIHAKAAEERLGLRKSKRSPTQFERELERIKKSAEERAELLAQRDALLKALESCQWAGGYGCNRALAARCASKAGEK